MPGLKSRYEFIHHDKKNAYLAVQPSLAFDESGVCCIAFNTSSFLMIRETSIICVNRIWILFEFDVVLSASDGHIAGKNRAAGTGRGMC